MAEHYQRFLRNRDLSWAGLAALILLAMGTLSPQHLLAADVAGSTDHPMLSRFPGSSIIAYDQRAYDQIYVPGGGEVQGRWLNGKMTWIVYEAPAGASTLQLLRNYEKALSTAGFTTNYTCSKTECGKNFIRNAINPTDRWVGNRESFRPGSARALSAMLQEGDAQVWVSLIIHERSANGPVVIRQEVVEPGIARPPPTLPAELWDSKSVDYDEARMAAGKVVDRQLSKVLNLEGSIDWRVWVLGRDVSPAEVFWGTRENIRNLGFEELFSCARHDCGSDFTRKAINLNGFIAGKGERWSRESVFYILGRKSIPGRTEHISVLSYQQPNELAILRQLRVTQVSEDFDDIEVSARQLAEEIDREGKVAVYGIYFDVNEASLKPESQPTLAEIAQLLQLRPALALYVDGHTDDQGEASYNQSLSERRARAVIEALAGDFGVRRSRLEARGFGESAPVAGNGTAQDRELNRRVELVAQSSAAARPTPSESTTTTPSTVPSRPATATTSTPVSAPASGDDGEKLAIAVEMLRSFELEELIESQPGAADNSALRAQIGGIQRDVQQRISALADGDSAEFQKIMSDIINIYIPRARGT